MARLVIPLNRECDDATSPMALFKTINQKEAHGLTVVRQLGRRQVLLLSMGSAIGQREGCSWPGGKGD